jgi:exopolysaccharide biosynthesis WecB/TagA/CpsF family protein
MVISPDLVIGGVAFTNRSMGGFLEVIEQAVSNRTRNLISTVNLDVLVQSMKDIVLQRIIYGASWVTPDGMPIVWTGRLLSSGIRERVAGSDLIPALVERASHKGFALFFLGGQEGVARLAAERCRTQWPGVKIVGTCSPPFSSIWEMDNDTLVDLVNRSAPDILLVALGCPKQEKWLSFNYRRLNVPVMICVGATLDFLSGRIRRAPKWVQSINAEWIFRLLMEPRRMARRYAVDIRDGLPRLAIQTLVSTLGRKEKAKKNHLERGLTIVPASVGFNGKTVLALVLKNCTTSVLAYFANHFEEHVTPGHDAVILDLAEANTANSETLTAVVNIDRRMRKDARHVILIANWRARLDLRAARLYRLFPVVPTIQAALNYLALMGRRTFLCVKESLPNRIQILHLHGEVTNDSAASIQESMAKCFDDDLSTIIDMTGVRHLEPGGLREILSQWRLQHTGPLHICSGRRCWHRELSDPGLRRDIILHDTMQDALEQVGRRPQMAHQHAYQTHY